MCVCTPGVSVCISGGRVRVYLKCACVHEFWGALPQRALDAHCILGNGPQEIRAAACLRVVLTMLKEETRLHTHKHTHTHTYTLVLTRLVKAARASLSWFMAER